MTWGMLQPALGVQSLARSLFALPLEPRRNWRVRRLFGLPSGQGRSELVGWLFLRALGLIYLSAFTSLRAQVLGLYGSRGIRPIREYLEAGRQVLGQSPRELYAELPTLFWLGASDKALVRACRTAQLLSLALVLDLAPLPVLALLWMFYLSFVTVGRDFLEFQWDALLLEAGASALLVAPAGWRPKFGRDQAPWPAVMLFRWLAFRLHFQSGAAKLRSGDRTWRQGTACSYHFETQPLPTPAGWYAHHLPPVVLKGATAAVLAVECVAPFLTFAPRRLRRLGFWLLSGLQSAIAITGNYTFFNALTASISLWLLDDSAMPRGIRALVPRSPARAGLFRRIVTTFAAASSFAISAVEHLLAHGRLRPPTPLLRATALAHRVRAVNSYGLFSVMTVSRPEIAIEGSNDGNTWLEYEFRYKPSDVAAAPPWVAPHQPRLDWQLWFAALGPPPAWFASLLVRLLEASPDVLALFRRSPFGTEAPRYVRAVLYDYRMTDLAGRRNTGMWWKRERIGLYFPPIGLERSVGSSRTRNRSE